LLDARTVVVVVGAAVRLLFQHQLAADPTLEPLRQDANVHAAHEYTVRDVDVQSGTVTLQNPWGFDHPDQSRAMSSSACFPTLPPATPQTQRVPSERDNFAWDTAI